MDYQRVMREAHKFKDEETGYWLNNDGDTRTIC